jgi:GDPmannose 4,6-dehydratase
VKFYQASSSEMFGNSCDADGFQRLTTPMKPVSPYGCSKLLAYNLTCHYRTAYKLHAYNGILFNHESPRRGSNFVSNKIIKTAVQIKKGEKIKLELGNLDSKRDWGHAYDYVRAIHKIVNFEKPRDFIVATGEAYSVRDFCKITFGKLNLNYEDHVIINDKYKRPEELNYLRGDSSETKKLLNWKPTYSFEKMIDEMLNYWQLHLK